jgi:hypothetical protein
MSRRRAGYGLSVEEILRSFTICAMTIWDEFRRSSNTRAELELAAARPMWTWMQALSGVVAGAFADEAGR